jgi:hypothetical protein
MSTQSTWRCNISATRASYHTRLCVFESYSLRLSQNRVSGLHRVAEMLRSEVRHPSDFEVQHLSNPRISRHAVLLFESILSGLHIHKPACLHSLGLMRRRTSKFDISWVKGLSDLALHAS